MRKILVLILFLAGIYVSCAAADFLPGIETFSRKDRVLVLAPHPDDETIACAGAIQQALKAGAQVRVAYLTNGEHNELAFIVYRKIPPITRWDFAAMGQVRRNEAVKAMKYLGLDEDKLIFLGYPDFGTFEMFSRYWQTSNPFWSMMTRISAVPYKFALSPGAPYVAESMLKDLEKVLLDYRPNKIFVSHPADVNVDHKTLYLLLQVAMAELEAKLPPARVYPYLVHHLGWPLPRHLNPQLDLRPPAELADCGIPWWQYRLTPQQLKNKHRALLCYRSQTNSSAFYLLSFVRKNELFGDFPVIKPISAAQPLKQPPPPKKDAWQDFLFWLKSGLDSIGKGVLEIKKPQPDKVINRQRGPVKIFLEDGNLLIRVKKSNSSSKHRMACWIHLFGYRYDTPFARMPKLYVVTKYNTYRVFDGAKEMEVAGAMVFLQKHYLTLKLPLSALGRPDFILGSVKAYTGALPIYYSGFHRIDLTGKEK